MGGLAYDKLREHRHGYQNFVGTGTLGVQGALRRDEINDVAATRPLPAGARGSSRRAGRWTPACATATCASSSHDHYVVGANPDDSGRVDYRRTLPVLGAAVRGDAGVHLYATAGRGFETPTLNELAYRPNGQTGLNFDLQAARSNSLELGVKTRSTAGATLDVAVFEHRAPSDEIVDAVQHRRPLDLPERRLDAAARPRARLVAATCRRPARAGRPTRCSTRATATPS